MSDLADLLLLAAQRKAEVEGGSGTAGVCGRMGGAGQVNLFCFLLIILQLMPPWELNPKRPACLPPFTLDPHPEPWCPTWE